MLAKKLIDVLRVFVDFEQNYSSMRFFDPAQPMETEMHTKVSQIGAKLSDELSKLQQPIEGMSCEQWKICARLRHIFHNVELYARMKEEMIFEYREFKLNKSKHNFRML